MLPNQNRMKTRYEFNLTRFLANKLDQKIFTPYFSIFYVKPNDYSGESHIGIVVSKKTHKSAVKRNRIKRRTREIIRLNLDKIVKDTWLVIVPKVTVLDEKYEKISSNLIESLQKHHLSR